MTVLEARTGLRRSGIRPAFVALEMRRMLRNKRALIFSLIMPPVFFLSFGLQSGYKTQMIGSGNTTGYAAIVLAVVNVLAWATVFTLGSAFLFRRDTAR
ncbi:hypothetical protein [Nocardia sp. NBC_01388]|uniref:hypothetical protein n=1 Tax=Nocardia sp. NBC_01388 TaxID=2903596 RepID=UPI003255E32C